MTDIRSNNVRVTNSTFTISEYVEQLKSGTIIINKDYQRTDKVWPTSAKSFLMDTILLGYPMPKLSLYQRTDLKTMKTVKEIVDGQQRTTAIREFYENKFPISGASAFSGMYFRDLDEEQKLSFLSYVISVDIILRATPTEIREMFRRMNSYTVPLNPQEKRHAINQGEFKFFMVSLSSIYSESLKLLGVMTEKNLSRMLDMELYADIIMGWTNGIDTARAPKIDKFYEDNDASFKQKPAIEKIFTDTFSVIFEMSAIEGTSLMKPYNFFSLFLAIAHKLHMSPALETLIHSDKKPINILDSQQRLSALAEIISNKDRSKNQALVEATSESTNLKKNREARFKIFFEALSEGD